MGYAVVDGAYGPRYRIPPHRCDRVMTLAGGSEIRQMMDAEPAHRAPQALEIAPTALTSAVASALIAALDAELSARYPEPGSTHFRLEPAEVAPAYGEYAASPATSVCLTKAP